MIGGNTAIMYQLVVHMTIRMANTWYTITFIPPNMKATLLSITYRSFENLFIIVPVGVTSKKMFIGAFNTLEIMFSCKNLDDLILMMKMIIALIPTKMPVPDA